jgi:hypothetical protein
MSGAQVYEAITAVAGDLASLGVAKSMTNVADGYDYRSIDALMNRLAPILAKRKLCVLPRVLERTASERSSLTDEVLISVTLKVALDLVSPADGSRHTIEVYGEALDPGDKATAKALTAAYKTAMLQTFCVPVTGILDADASSFKLKKVRGATDQTMVEPEPVQGWEQWSADITELVSSCETVEALERVQGSNRALLRRLARERPELYACLGAAFSERRQQVSPKSLTAAPAKKQGDATRMRKAAARRKTKARKLNGTTAPLH